VALQQALVSALYDDEPTSDTRTHTHTHTPALAVPVSGPMYQPRLVSVSSPSDSPTVLAIDPDDLVAQLELPTAHTHLL
jgi:hypothetical protein